MIFLKQFSIKLKIFILQHCATKNGASNKLFQSETMMLFQLLPANLKKLICF